MQTTIKHAEIRKLLILLFYLVAVGFILFELVIVFYYSFFLVLVPLFLSNTVLKYFRLNMYTTFLIFKFV